MKITTNNQPRALLSAYELTEKERAEFDYLDKMDQETFVRYRGSVYPMSDFMRIVKTRKGNFNAWDGYFSDSFFSAVLIRFTDDPDFVVMGIALC